MGLVHMCVTLGRSYMIKLSSSYVCLFVDDRPTFVGIVKKRDVEQFSPYPYLATLLNCLMWVLYGLPIVHPDSVLVLTINAAGVAIELCYILTFVILAPPKLKLRVLLIAAAEVAFVLVFGALVISFLHTTDRRSTVVGILCIVFCIMMYVAPLSVMVSTTFMHYTYILILLNTYMNDYYIRND